MEGVVQAGKWRGYHVLYLIKLTDAAQRKAIAVCAACKPKITHIVHNIKTKFLRGGGGGERVLFLGHSLTEKLN